MKKYFHSAILALTTGLFHAQIITTIAGTGIGGFSGNGSSAITAELNNPTGIAFDKYGNTFISDYNNNQIRKIDPSGIITAFAGTGFSGFSGDGGLAINAELNLPSVLTFDNIGNLYIVDAMNGAIRKVTPAGIISTVAGNGIIGYSGDGGSAINAQLSFPTGIYIDVTGNIYIADRNNHRIRKINAAGIISTWAGTGIGGYSGDGGFATNAKLNMPNGITFDNSGNAYIADAYNDRIRKVNPSGIISTIAGTGVSGATGDGGSAINAQLDKPFGVTFDAAGNYYIADFNNNKIRKVNQGGIITTFAGTGIGGYNGDGGLANNAEINSTEKVVFDSIGNLYIPDSGNNSIRKIACRQPTISVVSSNSLMCAGESVVLTASGASSFLWNSGGTTNNIFVSPTTTTVYTVIGTNTVTGCRNSAILTQNVSPCIGIKELEAKNEFNIYPNPFNNKITITSNYIKMPIQIFNSLGALIYHSIIENEKTEINFSNQSSGIYFVKIGFITKKLIKE